MQKITPKPLAMQALFALALGFTGCDPVASARELVGAKEPQVCHEVTTVNVGSEVGPAANDTTEVCEVTK